MVCERLARNDSHLYVTHKVARARPIGHTGIEATVVTKVEASLQPAHAERHVRNLEWFLLLTKQQMALQGSRDHVLCIY